MADEQKGIALVILGIVAVIAVVGLILLFVQGKSATGEGIYGGAIKQVEYPYWEGRGIPRAGIADSSSTYAPGETYSNVMSTNWNFYGNPKRNPGDGDVSGDIPSVMTACPHGVDIDVQQAQWEGDRSKVYETMGRTGAYACAYPQGPLVGGIAGQMPGQYPGQDSGPYPKQYS